MADSGQMPGIYEDLIQRLHDGDIGDGRVDNATLMDVAQHLMEAVFTGYGKTFENLSFDTPDYSMLARLERDVYSFSYAKNYQMLKALTAELKDGNRVRSYTEFRQEASKILDEWVGNWLRTEYDTAIASAQMAARWVEFERDADLIPLLEYQTVGDDRVRDAHRLLDGVVKPVNDSFWNTYYPPNGWGCRCDVVQMNRGTVTPDKDIQHPEVPKMFKTNLAKHGLAFPKGHPYYKGIPKEELAKYVLNLPEERQYETIYRNGGGVVRQHLLTDIDGKDFKTVHQIALDKADAGHVVDIMPTVDPVHTEARATIFKGAKPGKNPDLKIDGVWTEVESPTKTKLSTISKRIGEGSHQADDVIITLPGDVEDKTLRDLSKGRFKTHDSLSVIEFEKDGIYTRFTRKDLL